VVYVYEVVVCGCGVVEWVEVGFGELIDCCVDLVVVVGEW